MTQSDPQKQHHDADGIIENRERRPPAYFNVLFYGLIIWGVIFMAYFLFSGWSSDAEFQANMNAHQQQVTQNAPAPAAPGAAPVEADAAAGKTLYASLCAMCHGAEGKGGIGPDLTAANYRYGKSEDAVEESIAKGRPNGMPGFGNQLSGRDIDNLAEFVTSLK
jgi:cytochrome c oxidase cbb3-type subunit 3